MTKNRFYAIYSLTVRLLKIEGVILYVEGLDAVNGTPILDIKMRWNALDNIEVW